MASHDTRKISITGKITLASVVLQAIVVTVLECFVIYYHVTCVSLFELDNQGEGISEADLIYHAIFILALCYQVVLAVDSIVNNVGLNDAKFKYSDTENYPDSQYAINYFRSKMRPLEYIIIGIVAGFSLYLALVSFKLSIADTRIRKAYILLSILQTLIKMDVFFVGAYAIQLIPSQKIGYSTSILETVILFICGTLLLLMAWFSISHELKFVLLVVINCLCFSLIYFVWKLVKVNMKPKEGVDPYQFTRKFLTFFLSVTLFLVILTIIYASLCFRNMILRIFESKKDSQNRQSMIDSHIRDRRESRLSLD
ncbi:3970_t:CDS:2 [Diversispora eburnea]|uniref:3970_t:CDS:1 n=1 Tax=Diversispora eburnea TaxID=1213867 RepID=A0A9N8VXX9_9GLOM|nr:3970_t:CDS:2 [Diversispora eburnea]